LFLSLILNSAYSIFLFALGQVYFSEWFFVMSMYYALLSIARIIIFFQINSQKYLRKMILIMRACGFYLLLLNFVVSVMMFILIDNIAHVEYHEIVVITLATYTFYSFTLAIISSVKYLKRNNHIYFCAKIVSLISASVSMVTLTNTMLETFGDNNTLRNVILPILSSAVAIFIIICAIFMIKKSNSDLRTLQYEKE